MKLKTKNVSYLFCIHKKSLFINILILTLLSPMLFSILFLISISLFSFDIFAGDGTLVVISGGGGPSSNHSYYIKDIQNAFSLFKPLTASSKRFYFIADGGEGTSANFISEDEGDGPKPLKYTKDGTSADSEERLSEPITGAAKVSVIKKKFKDLESMDDDNKPLYVYITDHGNQDSSSLESRIVLWGGEVMSVADLRESLSKIPSKRPIVLINEQCFGGGMLEALRLEDGSFRANSCGFASASELEPSTTLVDLYGNRKNNLISIFKEPGAQTLAEKFKMVGKNIISHPVATRDIFCMDYLKNIINSNYSKPSKQISKKKIREFQHNHVNYQELTKLKKQIEVQLKDYLKNEKDKDISIYRYKREKKALYETLQKKEKKYLQLIEKNDEIRGAFLTSDESYARYNLLKQEISDKKKKNVDVTAELQKEFDELDKKFIAIKKNMDEIENNCDYKFDDKYRENLEQKLAQKDRELAETSRIMSEKEAELEALKKDIETTAENIKNKNEQLLKAIAEEQILKEKIDREGLKKLNAELVLKGKSIEILKSELERRKKEKRALREQGVIFATKLEQTENELNIEKVKLKKLERLSKTRNEDNSQQIEVLNQNIAKLSKIFDELDGNLDKIINLIKGLDAENDEINIAGKQLEQAEKEIEDYENAQKETQTQKNDLESKNTDLLKLNEKKKVLEDALVLMKRKNEQDKQKRHVIDEHAKSIEELHSTVELAKIVFSSPLITENAQVCSDPCNSKFNISKDKDITLMQYGLYITNCFDREKLCMADKTAKAHEEWKDEIENFKPKRNFIDKLGQYQTIKHMLDHFDKKEERDAAKQLLGIIKCEDQIVDSR